MPANVEKEGVLALLHETSSEIGVRLSAPQAELFWLYLQELLEWNRRFPLTAVTDPADIVIKHFVDSLSPLPYLETSTNLLDIGSGAGFPGIPLKIAAPDLRLSLVDANRKKVSFLKQVVRTLKLQDVAVRHGRLEDLPLPEEPFTTIISRAFRRLEPLLDLASPLLAPGWTLIAMLGPTTDKDHRRFQELASAHGLHLSRSVTLDLPRGRGGRTLLFFVGIVGMSLPAPPGKR
jgi:16S rRNA (guanine527-N7)-methyltransferase